MDTPQHYQIDHLGLPEYDSSSLEESMPSSPAKQQPDWKWLFTTGLALLGIIIGSTWKVHDEFSKIDKHIAKIETAVRIIGAKQGGDTKTLIDEALAVAKNASDSGRTESAKAVLDIVNRMLAEQAASHEQAPQDFFDTTVTKLKQLQKSPALSPAVWTGTMKLAEFRSVLSTVPPNLNTVRLGELSQRNGFRYFKDGYISGPRAISFGDERGFVLDGTWLDNVAIENARIIYHGGPVILQNVRFVNCTFDVSQSPRGEQLLEAATKEPVNAAIG